ncbi:MAG: Uma2 family endonuclease [Leptolyngbya sp. SIO1D8]|nr:Uma2 family endonuclease [Leptolyngbya sp. SIO1D8]
MLTTQSIAPMVLNQLPELQMSDEQFFRFCQDNPTWQIERSAAGEILVMPPTGAETGERNFDLIGQLWFWAKQDGRGKGFDSSTGFTLPNQAVRSPDAAWISKERWDALPPQDRKRFAPICPDFVLELRSETDLLTTLQAKLEEYIANGARLGWLIDPIERRVHVYTATSGVEILDEPPTLRGDPVLPGLVLNLQNLWRETH